MAHIDRSIRWGMGSVLAAATLVAGLPAAGLLFAAGPASSAGGELPSHATPPAERAPSEAVRGDRAPAPLLPRASASAGAAPSEAVRESRDAAPVPSRAIAVTWTPERPVQGHLFRIRVAPDAGDASFAVTGTVAGEPLQFEPTGDGVWESLAAVPIEVEDSLPVRLVVTRAGAPPQTLEPTVPVEPGDYRHERLTVAPEFGRQPDAETAARLARDREKAAEVARQAHRTPRLWTRDVVLPRTSRVTSGFGNGRIFNDQISGRHMGLDLAGAPGDTVLAATRGVVELVDDFVYAGNIVYLNHGGGLLSGYFHLSEQLVQEGDTVEAGTPIGRVGATGRVTGPHLHWVVRYGRTSVDPRSLPALVGG